MIFSGSFLVTVFYIAESIIVRSIYKMGRVTSDIYVEAMGYAFDERISPLNCAAKVDEKPAVGITNVINAPIINSSESMDESAGINESPIRIAVIIVGKSTIRIAET